MQTKPRSNVAERGEGGVRRKTKKYNENDESER